MTGSKRGLKAAAEFVKADAKMQRMQRKETAHAQICTMDRARRHKMSIYHILSRDVTTHPTDKDHSPNVAVAQRHPSQSPAQGSGSACRYRTCRVQQQGCGERIGQWACWPAAGRPTANKLLGALDTHREEQSGSVLGRGKRSVGERSIDDAAHRWRSSLCPSPLSSQAGSTFPRNAHCSWQSQPEEVLPSHGQHHHQLHERPLLYPGHTVPTPG